MLEDECWVCEVVNKKDRSSNTWVLKRLFCKTAYLNTFKCVTVYWGGSISQTVWSCFWHFTGVRVLTHKVSELQTTFSSCSSCLTCYQINQLLSSNIRLWLLFMNPHNQSSSLMILKAAFLQLDAVTGRPYWYISTTDNYWFGDIGQHEWLKPIGDVMQMSSED